jgi:hypothetical protein
MRRYTACGRMMLRYLGYWHLQERRGGLAHSAFVVEPCQCLGKAGIYHGKWLKVR